MSTITFDSSFDSPTPPGDAIRRAGKLFALGDYADKAFSLTAAEADAAVAAFTPVPADYEHTPGPLDGQLGTLTRVWRDGDALYGEATVPAWLDPLLAESGRKLSLAWDRAQKRIVGWGWVRTPRVSDAALMSAYAAFAGARHSTTDQHALNTAHDAVVAAGAENCGGPANMAGMRHSATDQRALNSAHDLLVTAGASCPAATPKEAHMSLWDQFKAALEGTPAATFDTETPHQTVLEAAQGAQLFTPAPSAEFTAVQAENARLKAEAAAQRQSFAATFADGLVLQGRILPAARAYVLAAYAQALADDAGPDALVTFSDPAGQEVKGNRMDILRALFAALPTHTLTGEHIPGRDLTTLATTERTGPTDAEKRARLEHLKQLALAGGATLEEGA